MTCRELIDFLMSYLDGELAADVRAEFERHLAVCDSCVNYLDTYRATVQLEKSAAASDDVALPPLPEELVQAILAARGVAK
jgi:anti-sigma factor RsiW